MTYVSDIVGYLSVLLVLLAKAKRGETDAEIECLSKGVRCFQRQYKLDRRVLKDLKVRKLADTPSPVQSQRNWKSLSSFSFYSESFPDSGREILFI